ncbi:MAG: hypothetical protein GXO47_12540 [Chlorobi bacterium]|nr:hypothetical protein [Chlorobiota bacterium]
MPEFVFGMLLAKNQKLEKLFFVTKPSTLFMGIFITFLGYTLFFIPVLVPVSFLMFSIGVYLTGIQLSQSFIKNDHIARWLMKLKEGTYSLYLLHIVTITFFVKVSRELILKYFFIDADILNALLILFYSVFALLILRIFENKYYSLISVK